MVVIFFPAASETGVWQDRAARPSINTVHAPHCPSPQPYFVPVSCSRLRNTERRVSSPGASTRRSAPLTVKICMAKRSALRLFALVRNAPDDLAAVIADQQGAVPGDRHADGAAPDISIRRDEAGQEVLVLARRRAVAQGNANDLVAGALRAVPRAVLRGEDVAGILPGELAAGVEDHLERRGVRLQEHVGDEHFVAKLGVLPRVARVLDRPHVEPGPTVKAAGLDAGDVVRGQVVAQPVALVDGGPELRGLRSNG